ncbi:MAG: hypothetical protein IBV52_08445 [Candidatus Bathyarchaeota archaeon]
MFDNSQKQETVPEFLLMSPSLNDVERKRLLFQLQLWVLWKQVFPSKPFDYNAATRLQVKLATERAAHRYQQENKLRRAEETNLKMVQSASQRVGEAVVKIRSISYDSEELSISNPNSPNYDTKVRDKRIKDNYGTLRQILLEGNIRFEDWGDATADLKNFVDKLRYYDGFVKVFSFDRRNNLEFEKRYYPRNTGYYPEKEKEKKSDISKKPPKVVSMIVELKWQPISDHEIKKKLEKHLHRMTPHV